LTLERVHDERRALSVGKLLRKKAAVTNPATLPLRCEGKAPLTAKAKGPPQSEERASGSESEERASGSAFCLYAGATRRSR